MRGTESRRAPAKKRLQKYSWRRDRRGASGVVVTLLILLVAAGALSMFMGIYVPIWGKDTEAQQMKRIQTQMLGLKENIDLQILAGKGSTYTTRITIGDDGGPLFHLTRAAGYLSFESEKGMYIMANSSDQNDSMGLARGYLEYGSQNRYYVDQKYHYENGALIVVQGDRTVMKAGPHFDVRRDQDGNLTATVTLVSLTGVSSTQSGVGDIRVESTLGIYDVTSYYGGDWVLGKSLSLNLTTGYSSVWRDFFDSSLHQPGTGLVEGTDYQVSVWSGGVNATLYNVNKMNLGIAVLELHVGM